MVKGNASSIERSSRYRACRSTRNDNLLHPAGPVWSFSPGLYRYSKRTTFPSTLISPWSPLWKVKAISILVSPISTHPTYRPTTSLGGLGRGAGAAANEAHKARSIAAPIRNGTVCFMDHSPWQVVSAPLFHYVAAVDVDRLPSDVERPGRGQEHRHGGDVFRSLPAAQRHDAADLLTGPLLVRLMFFGGLLPGPRLPDCPVQCRMHHAPAQSVDPHS